MDKDGSGVSPEWITIQNLP